MLSFTFTPASPSWLRNAALQPTTMGFDNSPGNSPTGVQSGAVASATAATPPPMSAKARGKQKMPQESLAPHVPLW